MPESGGESYMRLLVHIEGDVVSVVSADEVPGPLVQPTTLTHGLAHELLVNGQRVAFGSSPDAAVSRSFSEIGPEGPREHHVQDLDTYEFAVRVPTSRLRGVNPAAVSYTHLTLPTILRV